MAARQIYAGKESPQLAEAADDSAAPVRSYGDLPFHGICCGDIVHLDHSLYGEDNDVMARTGTVFRNVVGNHAMTLHGRSHETSFTKFEDPYGPTYYSFDVGRLHSVAPNDNFYTGRQ